MPLIDGGTQRLPRIVGLGRALDMILTGRIVEAEEAERIGLLTQVVPAGGTCERALEIAEALARFPQDTMLADRSAALEGIGLTLRGGHAARGARRPPHARDGLGRRVALRRRRGSRRGRRRRLMPPAIEVADLHKSYGSLEAVRGVSFEVQPGEIFGLLGPNGAGKTTTVEILEGYRERSGGEVRVLGKDPQVRDRRLQERIGIVLQSSGFYPRVTVREAVTTSPRPTRPRATRRRRSRWSASRRRPTRAPRTCPAASAAGSTSRSP